MIHRWLGLAVLAFWAASFASPAGCCAAAEDRNVSAPYRQSAAVAANFPDLPVALDTPAIHPNRTTFTDQAELETYLLALARPDAPLSLQILATSPQGRNIPILYFSRERHATPEALRSTGRPTVWLIGQQHGNEPAGAEALLAIAKALAEGDLRPLLDTIDVVIVPRLNPDGAAIDARDTSERMDLNRDHSALTLAESRALHAAIAALPPDVVVDLHEFAAARRWLDKFGAAPAADLMWLGATHPMVPAAVHTLTAELFAPAIEATASAHAIRTFPYVTTSARRDDKTVSLGGSSPGIARNAFGLMGAVSILLETRGLDLGLANFQRRAATHYLAVKAILSATAANAARVKQSIAAARHGIAVATADIAVGYRNVTSMTALPMLDPESAADVARAVPIVDSRLIEVTATRPRPHGYLLLADAAKALSTHMALLIAGTCDVRATDEIEVESYSIVDRGQRERRAINPEAGVKISLQKRRLVPPPGSLFVSMTQASALRVAAALEPDAPGSLVALDVLKAATPSGQLPVMRIPVDRAVSQSPPDLCALGLR